jgi:hypothetical protein
MRHTHFNGDILCQIKIFTQLKQRFTGRTACFDVISILPTAWVVEPVGPRYRSESDQMGYKCDIGPLDLLDGGLTTLLHIARVSHQLEPYVSE